MKRRSPARLRTPSAAGCHGPGGRETAAAGDGRATQTVALLDLIQAKLLEPALKVVGTPE